MVRQTIVEEILHQMNDETVDLAFQLHFLSLSKVPSIYINPFAFNASLISIELIETDKSIERRVNLTCMNWKNNDAIDVSISFWNAHVSVFCSVVSRHLACVASCHYSYSHRRHRLLSSVVRLCRVSLSNDRSWHCPIRNISFHASPPSRLSLHVDSLRLLQ